MLGTESLLACNDSHVQQAAGDSSVAPPTAAVTDSTGGCRQMQAIPLQLPYAVEAYVEPWVFAVGVVTNVVSFLVLRHMSTVPSLRTVLLSLCVSDCAASLAGFTYIVTEVVLFQGNLEYGVWSPGALVVFTGYKVYLLFTGISSILIKTGSIIKTHALLNPLRARVQVTRGFTLRLIALIVSVLTLLFLPLSLYVLWKTCFNDTTSAACASYNNMLPDASAVRYYFFCVTMILGPGTIITNVICFALLKRAISRHHRHLQASNRNSSGDGINGYCATSGYRARRARQSGRINKTFVYGLVVHTLCIVPSCVQIALVVVDPVNLVFATHRPAVQTIDVVAETSLALLPCYNFWLYLLVNKDFRRAFTVLFMCRGAAGAAGEGGRKRDVLAGAGVPCIAAGLGAVHQTVVAAAISPAPDTRRSLAPDTGAVDTREARASRANAKSVRFSDVILTLD